MYAGQHKVNGIHLPDFAALAVAAGGVATYMHGKIDKPQANHRLSTVGEYLVRESKSQAGELVLCLRLHAQAGTFPCCSAVDPIAHILIKHAAEGFHLRGASLKFPAVEDLICHYVAKKTVGFKPPPVIKKKARGN